MQRLLFSFRSLLMACAILTGPVRAGTNPAAPTPAIAPPNSPRSEFNDDVDFGKDPFFPQSTRRPKVLVKTTEVETPRQSVPGFIVLKGISVLKDKKLAIINNYTLSEGEEFTLKTTQKPLLVKCVEIKEKSVIVSVNGATKELPLRPGF